MNDQEYLKLLKEEVRDLRIERRLLHERMMGNLAKGDNGIIWPGEYNIFTLIKASKEMLSHIVCTGGCSKKQNEKWERMISKWTTMDEVKDGA